jgi:hypothetical protein
VKTFASSLIDRLKARWPGIDFDARTFVRWTDGPTVAEVQEALGDAVNGDGTFERDLSPEFRAELEQVIAAQSGEPFNEFSWYEGGFKLYALRLQEGTLPGYGNEQVGQLAEQVSR